MPKRSSSARSTPTLIAAMLGVLAMSCSGARSAERRARPVAKPAALPVASAPVAPSKRPAVLFASPTGAALAGVDLAYLRELAGRGFEVDYSDKLDELDWDRIRHFNALVLFATPDSAAVSGRGARSDAARHAAFPPLIQRYVEAGGGVLLMPGETNFMGQKLAELTNPWGAKLLAETIDETDEGKLAPLDHASYRTRIAFTDQIEPSPVTEGVHGIWYPYEPAYFAAMTTPLVLDDTWRVVVRASATAVTHAVDLTRTTVAVPGVAGRNEPLRSPPIMAIRSIGKGRVALLAEWSQFSIGAGTKWIYDRQVLERGAKGRPSDFGRLLENTYRWLAEPSLAEGSPLGGFTTPPDRLDAPNAREAVRAQYRPRPFAYDAAKLDHVEVPNARTLRRGLIGAKTAYSSGKGTVAEYAAAARKAKLDFVVFLEDFDRMTPEKLASLAAECREHSSADLLLLPGFSVESNLGNRLFFFSPEPTFPPEKVLTGKDRKLLYIQEEDGKGSFTGYHTPFLDWVLSGYHVEKGQVGYYDFADAPHGLRLHDARLYASVGLRYYRHGRLVEDLLDEYLTTAQSSIAPTPFAIDEVASPDELVREAASRHAMTYALADSLDAHAPRGLFRHALRWSTQYDAMPVFVSSGPKILSWPSCDRIQTYGAEAFSPARAVEPAPLAVTSDVGLAEIRIYDGARLFRRFALHGEHRFDQELVLDGANQRDLVLVATDRAGGVAVAYPRRSWADGALAPSFCSDHVNDCGHLLLAHGPWSLRMNDPPELPRDVAGETWDGGPPPVLPVSNYQDASPVLDAVEGKEDAWRLDPIPLLELSDEGAVAVESVRRDAYDKRLLRVVNPWHTYGPIDGPAPFFENDQRYRQWLPATTGAPEVGWAAVGDRAGVAPSLFTDTLRFRRAVTIRSLRLARMRRNPDAILVVSTGGTTRTVDLAEKTYPRFTLAPGDWFGFYGKRAMNAQLFVNRAAPVQLQIGAAIEIDAEPGTTRVKPGDTYTFEVAALGFPLDEPIASADDLAREVEYLRSPEGLDLARGHRIASPGLLDVGAGDGAVELSLPRPSGKLRPTVPLRISGLNPRFSAGLFQRRGFSAGFYGSGSNRYRSLGVDRDGAAYVPLYVDRADETSIVAGHPIVADGAGRDLFIQVTCLGDAPYRWHVSVNNPTDHAITAVVRRAMDLPGLDFAERRITLRAGEYRVLE